MLSMDKDWKKLGLKGRSGMFQAKQVKRALATELCLPDMGDMQHCAVELEMQARIKEIQKLHCKSLVILAAGCVANSTKMLIKTQNHTLL